jgi:16S rRNA (cytosine1407-C5)-methyltransferase
MKRRMPASNSKPEQAVADKLPPAFLERLRLILPQQYYQSALASFAQPGRCTFRVNTLKTTIAGCISDLRLLGLELRPWEFIAEGFSVAAEQREALVYAAAHQRGEIYIQNYSSMVPPRLLKVEPGQEVLDLAAAPGGKTLHLAAIMGDRGRLAAVELVKRRFHRLRHNVERSGASIVHLYCKDGSVVGRQVPGRFNRVLLDAPCSSESRFTLAQPKSWSYWSENKIAQMQRKQKQLLYSAVLAAKPGGLIAYSTCSFAPEENELVVAHVLKKFAGQLSLEEIDLPIANTMAGLGQWRGREINPALQRAVRILPTATMSGFFVCLLRKH